MIADLYDVDPSKLTGDPVMFAQILGNPERIRRAEQNIAEARRPSLKAVRECPRQESNLRTWFRKPLL
jgi:hypothetical protein